MTHRAESIQLQEFDALWAVEAEDRINAFERGEIKAISCQDAFDSLEKRS